MNIEPRPPPPRYTACCLPAHAPNSAYPSVKWGFPGVVGEGPSPLQLLLMVEVSSRGVGIGHPRSVSWDRSGTTLALGTVGNAVCLVQPGEVSSKRAGHSPRRECLGFQLWVLCIA